MLFRCPTHGPNGVCIVSPNLLEIQADGTLPEIVTIEVKDSPEQEAFFRFNLSPREAERYPIVDGMLPFSVETCEIMEGLKEMCSSCFVDRRLALKADCRQDGKLRSND